MSLLPTSTFAGPSQAEALWAVAGSVGPGGGVTQLVAGSGITLDPSTGEGVVTINATGGGGGGGVSSVTASGAGITASPTSGAVVVANTGVTSLVAGAGMAVSSASGAVTISTTAPYTTGNLTVSGNAIVTGATDLRGALALSNVQGTYQSPVVAGTQSAPLEITGTSGYIRIPYSGADVNGQRTYIGHVNLPGDLVPNSYLGRMVVSPNGLIGPIRNILQDRLQAPVANVCPGLTLGLTPNTYVIFGSGYSVQGENPVGTFMEATFIVYDSRPLP